MMESESTTLVLFGATGNLAGQKLFPALFDLFCHQPAHAGLRMVAVGRRPYDTGEFLRQIAPVFRKRADFSEERWLTFSAQVEYFRMDLEEADDYARLATLLSERPGNRALYLAVPPQSYAAILKNLSQCGLKENAYGWTRIVVEKPFGHDLASAVELNREIHASFDEDQIYRIDHYLGKETVQNMLAFRFANGLFEPLWNAEAIDHVQITVAEEEGIAGRGNFYDKAGAFRDLVQNHILQLVSLLTMDEPPAFTFDAQTDEKMKVLEKMSFDPSRTVFGQYEGYGDEDQVAPGSGTETYAMTVLNIDTPRWAGVPIYLRTGKALAKRITEISVQFKASDQRLFAYDNPESKANVLTFRIQPDEGISLRLAVKTPRQKMMVQTVNMEFCYGLTFKTSLPDAYERLFADILEGDQTLCLRDDLIEASWKLVDAILTHKETAAIEPYARGSWGPARADDLIEADGRRWLAHESTVCNGVVLEEGSNQS